MSRKSTQLQPIIDYMQVYNEYREDILSIAIGRFNYLHVPEEIPIEKIEETILKRGCGCFYRDADADLSYILPIVTQGKPDCYGNPVKWRCIGRNGFQSEILTKNNSVLMWNNPQHSRIDMVKIDTFAHKFANIELTIAINLHAQKTPILILCPDGQRLTMEQLYSKYAGNKPVIMGNDFLSELSKITVLKTDAPYLIDKLYQYKVDLWNEMLTYFGVPNVSTEKSQVMLRDEIMRRQGGNFAKRVAAYQLRKDAVDRINKMFNTNIEVVNNYATPETPAEKEVIKYE